MTQNIPDWIQWIAQDEDGQWWGYEAEPHESERGWYENEVGRLIRLNKEDQNPHWRLSLQRIIKN